MSSAATQGRHGAPEVPGDISAEFKDAVSTRTVALLFGVLLLQLGFILSYVGAFHAPTPHQIPLAVVSASAQASDQTVAALNGLASTPIKAASDADQATAELQIRRGDISAALVINVQGTTDTLLVATGGGASVATAVTTVITEVEAAQQRTVTVRDIVPLQSGDGAA